MRSRIYFIYNNSLTHFILQNCNDSSQLFVLTPCTWDFCNWRNNNPFHSSKIQVKKLHIIIIFSLLWTRRIKLGTWQCGGSIKKLRGYIVMERAAITATDAGHQLRVPALEYDVPAEAIDVLLYPFPPASCQVLLAFLQKYTVRNLDRNIFLNPVQPEFYQPGSPLSLPLRTTPAVDLLGSLVMSETNVHSPHVRLVLQLRL